MKRLGLVILACVVAMSYAEHAEHASRICGKNAENQLADLKKLGEAYERLDSKIGACVVAPEKFLSDAMFKFNELRKIECKSLEFNKINFLLRAAKQMREDYDRYDEVLSGRSPIDYKVDIPRRIYIQSFLKLLKNLYEKYQSETGQLSSTYSPLGDYENNYPNSTEIQLEITGQLPYVKSTSTMRRYFELIPTVEVFLKDIVKMIVKYQPKRYEYIAGLWYFNTDYMLDFYIFASKIHLNWSPESILDVVSFLPNYLLKLIHDYKKFAIQKRTLSEFDLKYLSIPDFTSLLDQIANYLSLQSCDSSDVTDTASKIASLISDIYTEYDYYLKNPEETVTPTLNARISDLESHLLGLKKGLHVFVKLFKHYQPAGYDCTIGIIPSVKSANLTQEPFGEIEFGGITLAIEYFRKKEHIKLGKIKSPIDTIRNEPKIIEAFLRDNFLIRSGKKKIDQESIFLLNTVLDILIYDGWFLEFNDQKINPNKYGDIKNIIDQVRTGYQDLLGEYVLNSGLPWMKSPFVDALDKLLPKFKKLHEKLAEIYTELQCDRDVKILTKDAKHLVSRYNSKRKNFNLTKETLVKGVVGQIPKNVGKILSACRNVEWNKCQTVDTYSLEFLEFWAEIVKIFGKELTAVDEFFGIERNPQHLESFDGIIKKLNKLEGVYEYKLDYEQQCSADVTTTETIQNGTIHEEDENSE